MPLFLENSFSLNNYISVSNRIKKIPFYYLHFLPIHSFKNLDEQYKLLPLSKSNLIQREIKHKIVYFQKEETNYSFIYERNKGRGHGHGSVNNELIKINGNSNGNGNGNGNGNSKSDIDNHSMLFNKSNFAKCIYHVFYSCSILHANKISFTLNENPFVSSNGNGNENGNGNGSLPLLYDFSHSFYFPIIQSSTFKMYFPKSLLYNRYIPFDLFLFVYLIHNQIEYCCDKDKVTIIELFSTCRENIDINTLEEYMNYFHNYHSDQIIQYLLQFKYTWSYYSLCCFFIEHYSDLLIHFSLHDLFYSYIRSSCKDRNNDIVSNIHSSLFST